MLNFVNFKGNSEARTKFDWNLTKSYKLKSNSNFVFNFINWSNKSSFQTLKFKFSQTFNNLNVSNSNLVKCCKNHGFELGKFEFKCLSSNLDHFVSTRVNSSDPVAFYDSELRRYKPEVKWVTWVFDFYELSSSEWQWKVVTECLD